MSGSVPTASTVRDVGTPTGPARVHVHAPPGEGRGEAHGVLVLGHGAGGGVGAVDLVALAAALPPLGWTVALVEMPWRVAGRRMAPPPPRLDEAWVPLLASLRTAGLHGEGRGRLVVGGRSAGARVACRTAAQVGADAVLALSFPLVPPGKGPERSRAAELAAPVAAGLPVLVVQGRADPFGAPDDVRRAVPEVEVAAVPGAHSFRGRQDDLVAAVLDWLASGPTRPT